VSAFVIDSSVVGKWLFAEPDSTAAIALRRHKLVAPDLLMPECANSLWKKVRRNEITEEEALFAARLLEAAEIELFAMRPLVEPAVRIALELQHPAYDCTYLALADLNTWHFVTADERFMRKVRQASPDRLGQKILSLAEASTRAG
jgi:predicted nucleic acid-binding protein